MNTIDHLQKQIDALFEQREEAIEAVRDHYREERRQIWMDEENDIDSVADEYDYEIRQLKRQRAKQAEEQAE